MGRRRLRRCSRGDGMPAFTTPRLLVTVLAIGVLIPGAAVVPAQAAAESPCGALQTATVRPHVRPGGAPGGPGADTQAGVVPLLRQRRVRDGASAAGLRQAARRHDAGGGPARQGQGPEAPDRQPVRQPRRTGRVRHGAGAGGAVLPRRRGARPLRRGGHRPAGHQLQRPGRLLHGQRGAGQGLAGLNVAFPYTKAEERAAVASSRALGKACSHHGRPLSASMSTAEVARDMDVIRRAVGDQQLNYLGFSYGSYLGQVYANLFPDRVRAVAIDGVLDPVAWAGTTGDRVPAAERPASAPPTARARRCTRSSCCCDKAGGQKCRFSPGNPVVNYDVVADRLKADAAGVHRPLHRRAGHVHLRRPRGRHARLALRPLRLPRDHRQPGGPDHPHRAAGQGLVRRPPGHAAPRP